MTVDLFNYKTYRSILCLNGDLPPPSFFLQRDLPVVAADGAANSLLALGIRPKLIIGDLDSVDPKILNQYAFLLKPDQNTSDYQKSLVYLHDNKLLPSIVVG